MEPLAKRLLGRFDELRRETLELEELASDAPPAEREALRQRLDELVEQGLLRVAGAPEGYARTEVGRLALAGPRDVTLYSRPGCHLCNECKRAIVPLLRVYGATLREVNIDTDPELRERYTNDVPVIFLGARKVAKHRIKLDQFRRQLQQAQRDS